MMKTFTLEIITPERKAFEETVDMVTAPTPDGLVGIMANHVPLFTSLSEGEVKIKSGNNEYFLAIGGGFMEVTASRVSILVSRAVHAHEINEAEIKKALDGARDVVEKQPKGLERNEALAIMRRSVLELKIAGKRRKTPMTMPQQ